MKKIFLLICLLCVYACAHIEKEYKTVITYTINENNEVTDTVLIKLPVSMLPAYTYDGTQLVLMGVNGTHVTSKDWYVVYSGLQKINVKSFDYEFVKNVVVKF